MIQTKHKTLFEFDYIGKQIAENIAVVPDSVYDWLKKQCLSVNEESRWIKLSSKSGQEVIQFVGYVGVLRAPCGYQLEILPKTGKSNDGKIEETRGLLIHMLQCMREFRHYKTPDAALEKVKMPLLEVFIQQFLLCVESVVRRGLRSDYIAEQDNLFALRGKLLWSQHIKQNLVRKDRFFTEHDEFSSNRAENRLLHLALHQVIKISQSAGNQKLARELRFVFNDIPLSLDIAKDFQRVRLDRGMAYYEPALDWAKLLLLDESPLTGLGNTDAISLIFPMAALFEAYVAKHLRKQLKENHYLKEQVSSKSLVTHAPQEEKQKWFKLKPDLLIYQGEITQPKLILDTKWKLLDIAKNNGTDKYDLSQADFYQLFAYGHLYYTQQSERQLVLIYPMTESFDKALPVFIFNDNLSLWVLPFCLNSKKLLFDNTGLNTVFKYDIKK